MLWTLGEGGVYEKGEGKAEAGGDSTDKMEFALDGVGLDVWVSYN